MTDDASPENKDRSKDAEHRPGVAESDGPPRPELVRMPHSIDRRFGPNEYGVPLYSDAMSLDLAISSSAEFDESGNPIDAIFSLLLAHRVGFFPPRSVQDWLARGLNYYLRGDGDISLDKCFGLSGKPSVFKDKLRRHRDEYLMQILHRLVYFGATQDFAAALVAHTFKEADWNPTKWKLDSPNAESLKQMYTKRWRKVLQGVEENADSSDEAKREFLADFPESVYKKQVMREIGVD